MKKPFLLIAGDDYYPGDGTTDWIGCYETYEEANKQVEENIHNKYYDNYTIKVSHEQYEQYEQYVRDYHSYEKVSDREYVRKCDWYKIVDLRDWVD